MVLLDLLHIQRAGFFKFLKSGIDKELSQLNLNVENTRLQVIPFLTIPNTYNALDLTRPLPTVMQPGGRYQPSSLTYSRSTGGSSSLLAMLDGTSHSSLTYGQSRSSLPTVRLVASCAPQRLASSFNMLIDDGTSIAASGTVRHVAASGAVPAKKPNLSVVRYLRYRTIFDGSSVAQQPTTTFGRRASLVEARRPTAGQAATTSGRPTVEARQVSTAPIRFAIGGRLAGFTTYGRRASLVKAHRPQVSQLVAGMPCDVLSRRLTYRRAIKSQQLVPEIKETQLVKQAKYGNWSSKIVKDLSNDKICLNQNSYFRLVASKYTPREAILYQKSWSCKLVVKVLLTIHEKHGVPQNENKGKICSKINLPVTLKSKRKTTGFLKPTYGSTTSDRIAAYLSVARSDREAVSDPAAAYDGTSTTTYGQVSIAPRSFTTNFARKLTVVSHHASPCTIDLRSSTEGNSSNSLPTIFRRPVETYDLHKTSATLDKPLSSEDKTQKRDHELFLVLGELPLMTRRGHFIIHGSPRVILSQLIRTPGIYFTQKNNELQADCVPEQGPWLCIYKSFNDDLVSLSGDKPTNFAQPLRQASTVDRVKLLGPLDRAKLEDLPTVDGTSTSFQRSSLTYSRSTTSEARRRASLVEAPSSPSRSLSLKVKGIKDPSFLDQDSEQVLSETEKRKASYFCYTKQFSSMPFSLIYSTFRVFELHSQFTDQTLLLTKLKTLEKIRKFKEIITTLLTFTWKKRTRKRLQRLYTKRCFTLTQQFEKTKVLFRLKNKLILGPLSRKSFNEKLGISSCINTGTNQNAFTNLVPYGRVGIYGENESLDSPQSFDAYYRIASTYDSTSTGLYEPSSSMYHRPVGSTTTTTSFATVGNRPTAGQATTLEAHGQTSLAGRASTAGRPKVVVEAHPLPTVAKLVIARSNEQKKYLPPTAFTTAYTDDTKNSILPSLTYSAALKDILGSKQAKWLSSTTLLSRDLALIARSLDGYKIMPEDDIDDLNNQRVRTSSDQIQQQVRVGFFRFKKMFVKLISSGSATVSSQSITDFLNGALREFFGSNPLSQFLDQTNPLAEITHKRRISKLGLGGIQRESATLKVRTIHSTYFGRICPIETPEGLNAGLVNSLTCLSRVDQKGQLVTPLSLLIEKQKQEQFFYYSNKENTALSTTDTALLKFQRLPNQFIYTKNESQFQQLEPHKVKLRVKSDLQTISLATALIPFLAYDDANRALMGSNMQRQAVPLILPERPIVRTGMESLVINESGHSFQASCGGFVSYISAQHMIILCNTLNKRLLL